MSDTNSKDDSRHRAFHEAGHAVAAIGMGLTLHSVDVQLQHVEGVGETLGGANIAFPQFQQMFGKGVDAVHSILVVLFAGNAAERLVNSKAELDKRHDAADGVVIMKYLAASVTTPKSVDGQVVSSIDEEAQERIRAAYNSAESEADQFVDNRRHVIEAVAESLVQKKFLTGDEVSQIVEGQGDA